MPRLTIRPLRAPGSGMSPDSPCTGQVSELYSRRSAEVEGQVTVDAPGVLDETEVVIHVVLAVEAVAVQDQAEEVVVVADHVVAVGAGDGIGHAVDHPGHAGQLGLAADLQFMGAHEVVDEGGGVDVEVVAVARVVVHWCAKRRPCPSTCRCSSRSRWAAPVLESRFIWNWLTPTLKLAYMLSPK